MIARNIVQAFRETTTDLAGNTAGSAPWTVSIDRAGPGIVPLWDSNWDAATATVSWLPTVDPNLADGSPGSGTEHYNFRYSVAGGAWSAWADTTDSWAFVAAPTATTVIALEVTGIDAAGNAGVTSTATLNADQDLSWTCETGEYCGEGPYDDTNSSVDPDDGWSGDCDTLADCQGRVSQAAEALVTEEQIPGRQGLIDITIEQALEAGCTPGDIAIALHRDGT